MVEVAVMVDPASTQAGQVTFSTHRREEAGGQNCGQGFLVLLPVYLWIKMEL